MHNWKYYHLHFIQIEVLKDFILFKDLLHSSDKKLANKW